MVIEVDTAVARGVPVRRACRAVGLSPRTYYFRKRTQEIKEAGEPLTHPAGIDTPGDDRKMPSAFYSKSPETTETTNAIHP